MKMSRIYTTSKDHEKQRTQLGAVLDIMPVFTQTKRIDFEKIEKKRKEHEARIARRRKLKPTKTYVSRSILAVFLTVMIWGVLFYDGHVNQKAIAEGLQGISPIINLQEEKPQKTIGLRSKADETRIKKEAVQNKIRRTFGDKSQIALAISQCESGHNESSIGDVTLNPKSYGIFQIRAFVGRPSPTELLDYKKNIEFAYKLSKKGTDWSAWSCFSKGYYKKYLSNYEE